MTSAELRELARLNGIQLTYDDASGKKRSASRESLEAALRALLPEGAKLDKALAKRRAELEERVVEPVIVAWNGKLKLPKINQNYAVVLEDGVARRSHTGQDTLPFGYH
ncbi:MAG TPA: hypothetical protein VLU46_11475, partial [Thermoanaerobaculia bacterium]|nr:hypothetical protein [Thermoanaerobaculia bacterium]